MMSLNLKLDLLECEMSSSETSHTSNGGATSESSRSASVSPGMFSSFRKLSEMWHPHVYAQPPKKPTPFSINDILQQENEESSQKQTARQPQYPFHLQQNSIMSILGGNPLGLTMGVKQIEVATAMRSLVAALSASAPAAVHSAEGSSPSPPSTCGSPGRISGTPSTEDDVDQPLNLTTSNKPHLSDSDLSSGMKGLKRKKESLSKYEDSLSADEDSKKKKVRTTFTGRQIFELEKMFESKKYLSSSERSDMAKLLNVTEQQVKIWFQNRRTKWKKQENISNAEAAELMKSKSIKETSPSSQTAPSMKSKSSHSSMGNLTEKGPSPHQGSISPPTSFIRPSSSTSSHSMPGLERLTSSSGGQHKIFHYPESSLHGEDFDNSSDVDDDDDVDNDDDEEDRLVIEEQGTSSDCQNNNNSFGGSQKETLNSGLLTNTLS